MKNVMKKIVMMGMLSCMVSSNLYSLFVAPEPTHAPAPEPALWQSQVDSLSKSFATVAHDAPLSDTLKNEYKALTASTKDLITPLKTGGTIDRNKAQAISTALNQLYNDLQNDSQYQQYAKSNQAIISNLQAQLSKLQVQLSTFIIKYEADQQHDPTATKNISIIGNYGVLKQECGMGNGSYCIQWTKANKNGTEVPMPLTPVTKNSDNTYTLLSDNIYTQYFLADASGKPVGAGQASTVFINKTKWYAPANIIS